MLRRNHESTPPLSSSRQAGWRAETFALHRLPGALGIGGFGEPGVSRRLAEEGLWRRRARHRFRRKPAARLPADRYVITVKTRTAWLRWVRARYSRSHRREAQTCVRRSRPAPPASLLPLEVEFTGTGTSKSSVHFYFHWRPSMTALLYWAPGSIRRNSPCGGPAFAVHSKFKLDPEFLH